jgi:alkylation response protein AidB-like acyl-CoA dehydrogenase
VRLEPTDDQEALVSALRAMLADRVPMTRVRDGFDRALHDELAAAGVFSLRADGFGWADAALVFEELGRALVPGPLVWTHLAHGLPGVPPGVPVGGTERAAPGTLVPDFHDALLILDRDGLSLAPADAVRTEVVERPLDPLTPVRRLVAVERTEPVGGAALAAEVRRGGALLVAATCVGIAAACQDLAVAHATARHQFGRPVGSFQAVKHLCADMAVRTECARAATWAAACALEGGLGDADAAVSAAKVTAGRAAAANGRAALQVHGGMGFTWEVDVHLYLRRAWVLDRTFGTVAEHAERCTDALAAG